MAVAAADGVSAVVPGEQLQQSAQGVNRSLPQTEQRARRCRVEPSAAMTVQVKMIPAGRSSTSQPFAGQGTHSLCRSVTMTWSDV